MKISKLLLESKTVFVDTPQVINVGGGHHQDQLFALDGGEQSAIAQLAVQQCHWVNVRCDLGLIASDEHLEDIMASLAISGRHHPPALIASPHEANDAIRAAIVMGARQYHGQCVSNALLWNNDGSSVKWWTRW